MLNSFENLSYLAKLYESYLADPASVDPYWQSFFKGWQWASEMGGGAAREDLSLKIYRMIDAYRIHGHKVAHFNPLQISAPSAAELKLEAFGFTEADLSKPVPTCGFLREKTVSLQELMGALASTYCSKVGIEFRGMDLPEMESWIERRIEPSFPIMLSKEEKLDILKQLQKAEIFESFLHTKFVGQKRFSLEGSETLIPMLQMIVEKSGQLDVNAIYMGMAHRGRLNVLANILNKSYAQIFHEFEDHYITELEEGTGDVKYHKGFTSLLKTKSGQEILISIGSNPSHLEAGDSIVEGQTRGVQDKTVNKKSILPILIHGDASLAGQGVVYETLQLCRLEGYRTEGTIHIVVNNQIGFTTIPEEGRSTLYCTDIAKTFGAPVFHVNAEDPESAVYATLLALELRNQFGCDVFIDLYCYRKYGHNEGDEPMFTQPVYYKQIRSKKTILQLYKELLIEEGVIDVLESQTLEEKFKENLVKELEASKQFSSSTKDEAFKVCKQALLEADIPKIEMQMLQSLAERLCTVPTEFHLHPKLIRLLDEKRKMMHEKIDWGMGEWLGLGSLLLEGISVRLSGQDSKRGTFSHRHAVLIDQENASEYSPLAHLKERQGSFHVYNSPLSEYAVLGFEYGYALSSPETLVIWEAQFGDFVNGAEIIIDQFITSSEQKWGQLNGLVLFLPHGYEGQGPEHSSSRFERFLQLFNGNNLQVANCTTPAQLFHLLRRQAYLKKKKPLVLLTPKALLRAPFCTSDPQEFIAFAFQPILEESIKDAKTVAFCSGKVYYDLVSEREVRQRGDITFIRIEQIAPFPEVEVEAIIKRSKAEKFLWIQEEHENMGAWTFVRPYFDRILGGKKIQYVGRKISSSTAAGSYALHKKELKQFLDEAFG